MKFVLSQNPITQRKFIIEWERTFYLKSQFQGTLVPKLTLGTNWKTVVLGSWLILRVKVDSKNYNQHYIKHHNDNNSEFKTIFLNQNHKRNSFYMKTLDRFQDNVRFFIFELCRFGHFLTLSVRNGPSVSFGTNFPWTPAVNLLRF